MTAARFSLPVSRGFAAGLVSVVLAVAFAHQVWFASWPASAVSLRGVAGRAELVRPLSAATGGCATQRGRLTGGVDGLRGV